MELAKIDKDGFLDSTFCNPKIGAKFTELKNKGFLELVKAEQPIVEDGYAAIDSYNVVNGKMIQSWSIKVCAISIQNTIEDLKAQLASTDYIVTKCMEASLIGEGLPYDIQKVHDERQAIRDKINELEKLI